MNVDEYRYKKSEYVTAWKILDCLRNYGLSHKTYLMLETNCGLKFVARAPEGSIEGPPDSVRGQYYVVNEDGVAVIMPEVSFTLAYEKMKY